MYVHIDLSRGHIEIDEIGHLLVGGYQPGKRLLHSTMEIGMPHIAVVDKEELLRTTLTRGLRLAHEAADADHRCGDLYRQQVVREAGTEDAGDALLEAGGREVEQRDIAVLEGEGDIGMHQHDALQLIADVGEFRLVALQKLTTCRNIKEEVLDEEVGPHGASRRLLADNA